MGWSKVKDHQMKRTGENRNEMEWCGGNEINRIEFNEMKQSGGK